VRRLIIVTLTITVASCRTILPVAPELSATAELRDGVGRVVGSARLTEVSGGVRIVIEISGLRPGAKAVHIHAVGRCDPPDFLSAGDHFDPVGARHGLLNPEGPHAGDLPNITVEPDGRGRFETTTKRVTLSVGPAVLFDADGSAFVVHARPDDFTTDPDGGSGERIACGVITESRSVSGD
jgi:superoxide dismutase, Cu-Zn family